MRDWARAEGVRAVVVFDGGDPGEEERGGMVLVRTGDETADDWIVREAARYAPYWLVTSDRELRERSRGAVRTIGGGSFAREISKR